MPLIDAGTASKKGCDGRVCSPALWPNLRSSGNGNRPKRLAGGEQAGAHLQKPPPRETFKIAMQERHWLACFVPSYGRNPCASGFLQFIICRMTGLIWAILPGFPEGVESLAQIRLRSQDTAFFVTVLTRDDYLQVTYLQCVKWKQKENSAAY
jgi:hypothetical protein